MAISYAALAARQPAARDHLLALLSASSPGILYAVQQREVVTNDEWVDTILKRGANGSWTQYNKFGVLMPGCVLDENDEDKRIESEWGLYFREPGGLGHAGEHLLPVPITLDGNDNEPQVNGDIIIDNIEEAEEEEDADSDISADDDGGSCSGSDDDRASVYDDDHPERRPQ